MREVESLISEKYATDYSDLPTLTTFFQFFHKEVSDRENKIY